MSGDDVAFFRRLCDRRSSASDDDEAIARSMMQAAEQHFANGDPATAKWLAAWAERLGHEPVDWGDRAGGGDDAAKLNSGVTVASRAAAHAPSFDQDSLPAIALDDTQRPSLAFVPTNLPAERTWAAAAPVRPVTSPGAAPLEARDEHPVTGDDERSTESPSAPRTENSDAAGDHVGANESQADESRAHAAASPTAEVDIPVASTASVYERATVPVVEAPRSESTFSIDDAERLVAAAARTRAAADWESPIYREPPEPSAGPPITIAVVSFAAGIVSCAAVCIAWCFLPLRSGGVRRAQPTTTNTDRDRLPDVPRRHDPDAGSRIIEEFFDSNVELYQELAQTGDKM